MIKFSFKLRIALWVVIIFWASAFVGIRAGLLHYSPGGLALLRYLIASIAMIFVYFSRPHRSVLYGKDLILALISGVIGIGLYNITLNYGESSVTSGVASF